MERAIAEADWKLLRRLAPVALDRFCTGVLSEVIRLASDEARGGHARYLDVYQLLRDRDEVLGAAFDDPKRSTALLRLATLRSLGLVTDAEFAGFSPQTRAAVAAVLRS